MRVSAYRFAFVGCLIAGCQEGTEPPARRITPHPMADCPPDQGDLVLTALGDFGSPPIATIKDFRASRNIDWPSDFHGAEAATYPPALQGIGYAEPPDDVDLTLWSTARACSIAGEGSIPESRGGEAITAFDGGSQVIIAGLEPVAGGAVNNSAFTLIWDARTGARHPRTSLGTRRVAWATATPFGNGALIAGGLDLKFLPERPYDTAIVFRDGDVRDTPISIGDARARHGAIVLVNGATLLVGGEDERGVLDSMVAITPTDTPPYGTADVFMLGTLTRARKLPTVLRLATDEILVAGGVDGAGNPVNTLEWFSKEGGPCPHERCVVEPAELAGLADVAFVALSGGGALAVGGTVRLTGAPSPTVVWIGNDGAIVRLPSLTTQQRGTGAVKLVAAGDASPWLWNGATWHRFDPWQNAFVAPDSAPEGGPDADMPPPIPVDPGLFVWIERRGSPGGPNQGTLRGFRHSLRGPFARDANFLLGDPQHLAPSVPPSEGGSLWADASGLHLAPTASVTIADATYADVTITGESEGGILPTFNLGPLSIGTDNCPWPTEGNRFTVTRTGRTVTTTVASTHRDCPLPEGRVPIGLQGRGEEMLIVKQLTITRR